MTQDAKEKTIKENMAKIRAQGYPLIRDVKAENAVEIMREILERKRSMDKAINVIDYMRELPDSMKIEAVCWHALRQDWYALRHIPHHLQTKEMQIYALKQSPDALFCIKGELWDELIEIINEGE